MNCVYVTTAHADGRRVHFSESLLPKREFVATAQIPHTHHRVTLLKVEIELSRRALAETELSTA